VPGKNSPTGQDTNMEDLTAEAVESSQGSEEFGESEMEEKKESEESDPDSKSEDDDERE